MPPGLIPFPFGICRVCKDKATGVHYGVATCEGCKGFFKRTITRGDTYKCFFGGNCDIVPKNRNRCKSCRFRRCIETGMSVEAVRMGRIPKVEKEKALEVFQQTGSDFNKMEIVVKHSSDGKPGSNQKSSMVDNCVEQDDSPDEMEGTGTNIRSCTIHVSIAQDSCKKAEQDKRNLSISEDGTDPQTGSRFESQMVEQSTNISQDVQVSPSQISTSSPEMVSDDISSALYSFDTTKDRHLSSSVNSDVCNTEPQPVYVHQTSRPQSHLITDHDMMLDVKPYNVGDTANGFPFQHRIPSIDHRSGLQQCRKSMPVELTVASENMNHTKKSEVHQTVHAGNLFSDNFNIDYRSGSNLPVNEQPISIGKEASGPFHHSGMVDLVQPYNCSNVPMANAWGGSPAFQTGMTNVDPFISPTSGDRCFQFSKQKQHDSVIHANDFRQAQDCVQGVAQRYMPDVRASDTEVQQLCSQSASFSSLPYNHGLLMPTKPQSSVETNPNVTRPLPPDTPSSHVSSASSKSSGRWSRYSPSLLKVLIEHILECREERGIIERLKHNFAQSNTDGATVQMFLKLLDEIAAKRKSSDQTSSPLVIPQQSPSSKSAQMEKFLNDVEAFMKIDSHTNDSQCTVSTRMESIFAKTSLDTVCTTTSTTNALDSPADSLTRLRQRSCYMSDERESTCSSANSYWSGGRLKEIDKRNPRFHKKKKTEENSSKVSSSYSAQDEDEMEIRLTLDCMELAKDILYRLKPEHRQKLRLYKAGQIKMRVMTDSDEDVQEVYSKIFQSIPLLNERVLGFCENVRGFTELPKKDKEMLLKRAFYDIWMLTYAEYFYDGESHIILSTGELYTSGAMRRILNNKIVDTFLEFSQEFNALKLSDLEISLLCAIQLTSSDGLTLEDLPSVQKLHSHLIDVFDWEIKRNHSENHSRCLINIFKLMPSLAVINRLQKEIIATYPSDRFQTKSSTKSGGEKSEKEVEEEDSAMEI